MATENAFFCRISCPSVEHRITAKQHKHVPAQSNVGYFLLAKNRRPKWEKVKEMAGKTGMHKSKRHRQQ